MFHSLFTETTQMNPTRRFQSILLVCILTIPYELNAVVAESETSSADSSSSGVKLCMFDVDATPPLGTMMAYDRVRRVDELGLRCRGIVLTGVGDPIVLCAMDWIGIANASHDEFRKRVAKAAKTTPERVAVHCLHQHDAPRCDFSSERLLHNVGATDIGPMDGSFAREVLQRLESAVAHAMEHAKPVTHVGFGAAAVENVASNRRISGDDGRVLMTRYTATRHPEVLAEPVGVIDP